MKILCSLALAGFAGLIAEPSVVPRVHPVGQRTEDPAEGLRFMTSKDGVTQARCMIRSGNHALAEVRFEWTTEDENARVSSPVSVRLYGVSRTLDLKIPADLATIRPDAKSFGFVLRVPRIEGGGSLTWHHVAAVPADSDVVDLYLPDGGVQLLTTGNAEAPASAPYGATGDCIMTHDASAD